MKVEDDPRVDQRMFNSEASLFSEGNLLLTLAEGGQNFSHLGAGEKLNQSSTFDQWGKIVHLIYEAKNGNLEGPPLALS